MNLVLFLGKILAKRKPKVSPVREVYSSFKVSYQAMKRHESKLQRKVAVENRKATKYFGAGKQNDSFRCWKKIRVQEQEIEDLGRNSKTILPIEFYFIAILFSDSLICLHKIAIYIQIVELFNLFSFFFFPGPYIT